MVYDPSRPPTPPGQYSVTSVPSGGAMPVPPGLPPSPVPGKSPMIRERAASDRAYPGAPGFPSMPGGTPTQIAPLPSRPGFQMPDFAGKGMPNIEALRAFLDAYKNSLFTWRQSRPQAGGDMKGWLDTRPKFDQQGLMNALFAPPPATAPAPAPGTPPVPPAI